MVISFRKLLCFFLLSVCSVVFIISIFSAFGSLSAQANAQGKDAVTVIIDPGHGGG